ncbi:MAG TPA: nucleoside triphosphate pyrophosphohydrolase [Thermodesulfobium narugense]|uniref:Nucleoside triphosphate pyrophosphohydrolase n=1 Tax=Thermodesulfobium acidiphilum TaxID=1794699 RepID=A0A2R4VZ62_THEAF|nr:tetrapyrrole methylase family protein / MazG family protein [Thermodesulfobium acidiphilum]PMP85939.1 MAG: nucleoside triphosphate pyrophosphohydrolase [Thermodesulfobium narugense]HEM55835.1 nucleoside triphosphate pyrophosphohydrolase [Thermodesulfobium narugense]
MDDFLSKDRYNFSDLVEIVKILRSEKGCPWDKKQTHESIKSNLIEEAYEVIDAIDKKNISSLREELGDLLLQVVFHSQMEAEKKAFDIYDVIDSLVKKLIYRHPHVFGDVCVKDSDEVLKRWENLKLKSNNNAFEESIFSGFTTALPALILAYKAQRRAKNVGFDWDNYDDIVEKIKEEIDEFKSTVNSNNRDKMIDEMGDILFSVVNLARFFNIYPEDALRLSTLKFIKRFVLMERIIRDDNLKISDLDIEKLDFYWEKAKEFETG